jgi:hypothetical protein
VVRSPGRRKLVALSLALLAAYAYFAPLPGYNQDSRLDMVRAVVERGTLAIDAYQDNTSDKALVAGHYYSDKAPGQALVALPVVAATVAVLKYAPADKRSNLLEVDRYVGTLASSAIPTVIGAIAIALVATRLGASETGALFAALVYGLGTPAWVYATIMMGNNLAGAALAVAFLGAVVLRRNGSQARNLMVGLATGFAAGWAVVTEYPAAPAATIVLLLALGNTYRAAQRGRLPVLGALVVGAVVPALVLAAYNVIAFGSILTLSYSATQGWVGMRDGIEGVTYPKGSVLAEVTVGQFRGLLPLAPVLVFAPLGMLHLRRRGERAATATASWVVVYYFLYNASFVYWNGGWSYGPRYVGAALPFLCVGLAALWTSYGRLARSVLLILTAWGVVLTGAAVSTVPMPPDGVSNPVASLFWPALSGQLTRDDLGGAPASLGLLFGLRGPIALAPLVLVGLVGLCIWWVLGVAQALMRRSAVASPGGLRTSESPEA